MQKKPIFLTSADLERLRSLMFDLQASGSPDAIYIKDLEAELKRAVIVKPEQISSDVITLRSRVVLRDLDTSEEMTYTLVYPEESDASQKKVSVLAPVGTAILGYRVGDTFEWKVPNGVRRLQVLKVEYQPEAHGDFHL